MSPQNGGFIRAKLTRPRTFCYKNNVRNNQNGGFIRAKSGPLIRHQARILYLLILWTRTKEQSHDAMSLFPDLQRNFEVANTASHRGAARGALFIDIARQINKLFYVYRPSNKCCGLPAVVIIYR